MQQLPEKIKVHGMYLGTHSNVLLQGKGLTAKEQSLIMAVPSMAPSAGQTMETHTFEVS